VIVDALGNPLRLILTGGQVHDITQAEALLASIEPGALLADKGYDADHFADSLTARAIKVVIPPKSNRKVKRDCDFALYCERNLVERFFCIIKHFRAIATRYEKTARNFLAGLYQASKELTLFCKATAAVILFCLTELIREIGDGRGGQATAGFRSR
jgi:transposase